MASASGCAFGQIGRSSHRFLHLRRFSGEFIRRVKLAYGDAIVGDACLIDRARVTGIRPRRLGDRRPEASEFWGIEEALTSIWREPTGKGHLRNTRSIPMFGTAERAMSTETTSAWLRNWKAAVYLAGTAQIYQVCASGAPDGLVLGEAFEIGPARRR